MDASHTAYLSLGSNIGDRSANLERAVELLVSCGLRIVKRSSLYVTEPLDFGPQREFLNCVIEVETSLMPRQLLRATQEVEREMGRRRFARRGPRVIDIDLLLFGANVMRAPELEIPHPRMAERRFVLVPLAEIAPSVRHPGLKASIQELLAACPDRAQVRRWHEP
jgi:2-amino-4-hydroxy-6-hydroxymethyldihydropteridine diphosphokinase